jgi:hypothetical protein
VQSPVLIFDFSHRCNNLGITNNSSYYICSSSWWHHGY